MPGWIIERATTEAFLQTTTKNEDLLLRVSLTPPKITKNLRDSRCFPPLIRENISQIKLDQTRQDKKYTRK